MTVNCPSESLTLTLTSDHDSSVLMSVCDPIDLQPLLSSVDYSLTLHTSSAANRIAAFSVTFYVTGEIYNTTSTIILLRLYIRYSYDVLGSICNGVVIYDDYDLVLLNVFFHNMYHYLYTSISLMNLSFTTSMNGDGFSLYMYSP